MPAPAQCIGHGSPNSENDFFCISPTNCSFFRCGVLTLHLLHNIIGNAILCRRCEIRLHVYNFSMGYKIHHWSVVRFRTTILRETAIALVIEWVSSQWLNFTRRVGDFGDSCARIKYWRIQYILNLKETNIALSSIFKFRHCPVLMEFDMFWGAVGAGFCVGCYQGFTRTKFHYDQSWTNCDAIRKCFVRKGEWSIFALPLAFCILNLSPQRYLC